MSNQGIWQYQWPLKDFTDSLNTAEGWRDTFWQFKCWFLCSSYKLWPQLVLTFFIYFQMETSPNSKRHREHITRGRKNTQRFLPGLIFFSLNSLFYLNQYLNVWFGIQIESQLVCMLTLSCLFLGTVIPFAPP